MGDGGERWTGEIGEYSVRVGHGQAQLAMAFHDGIERAPL